MRILYVAREKLTLDRAPAFQIFHTLRGICEAGGGVRFITPWPVRLVRERCEALTGREFPAGLEVVSLGSGPDLPILARLWPSQVWSGVVARLQRYIQKVHRREPDLVIYTRNRRAVAALPPASYPPVVFEYHEPQSIVLAEERGHRQDDPVVEQVREEERQALANAASLVTVSQAHADEASGLYQFNGRQWVIPNAADPTIFSVPETAWRPRPGHLLYIGSIQPWQGLDLLLQAVARVPGARMTVCGGKPDTPAWREMTAQIDALGIANRIRTVGIIPQQNLRPYLASAVAGVLALNGKYSLAARYTCPLKLFEYMCAGLPVVATDLPSVRSIVQHEREALLFEDGNLHALTRTLARLINDPTLAARLSVQARQTAAENTWQQRGARIIDACQTALKEQPHWTDGQSVAAVSRLSA